MIHPVNHSDTLEGEWSLHGYGQFDLTSPDGSATRTLRCSSLDELQSRVHDFAQELGVSHEDVAVKATELDVLLFEAGVYDPSLVRIVDRLSDIYELLGCSTIERAFSFKSDEREDVTIDLYCDEEGKISRAPVNRPIWLDRDGSLKGPDFMSQEAPTDVIFGDFMLVGANDLTGELTSLDKYEAFDMAPLFNAFAETSPMGLCLHYVMSAPAVRTNELDGPVNVPAHALIQSQDHVVAPPRHHR